MGTIQILTVFSFLLLFSRILDELINKRPDFKKEMVSTIVNFQTEKFSDIVDKWNRIFFQLFGIIYGSESKKRDAIVWVWLFMSFSSSFLMGFMIYLYNVIISLELFLVLAVISPSIFIIYLQVMLMIDDNYLKPKISFKFVLQCLVTLVAAACLVTYPIKFLGVDYRNIYSILGLFVIIIQILISMTIGVLFFFSLSKRTTSHLNISPPRVIISSILVITIITLLKKDIVQSFIFDFNQIGIILVAYLLLNVFADSISLWETNVILRFSARGGIKKFILLGLLDLFLSASIFLAIPLSTGNLDIFFDSIWFKGEKPWLGILFWSTFSTSIIFWAFLLAIFGVTTLQKVLRYYVKLDKIIPIEENPITCISMFTIVIIMPFMFLIT